MASLSYLYTKYAATAKRQLPHLSMETGKIPSPGCFFIFNESGVLLSNSTQKSISVFTKTKFLSIQFTERKKNMLHILE